MSDPSTSLLAAWGEATQAWWALMAGSWTAVDAVVRAILEASYEEASISRVNEVDFNRPDNLNVADLGCTKLTRIGPEATPKTIGANKGKIHEPESGSAAAAAGTPRATLKVNPTGAATGDYVATIQDTTVDPPREVARVVVFVLGQ